MLPVVAVLGAFLLSAHGAGAAPKLRPPLQVSCTSCLVIDDTGAVLWDRAPDERVAIASTTKMVTALVVRAHGGMDDEVVVSGNAAATPEGKLDLKAGEAFSVKELLYGMLLNSSNDAAVALAEHVAGTETAFVTAMNAYVGRIGAADTHFTTAHGLDDPDHYSTATDLALITEELLDDPLLARIVATHDTAIDGSARTVALENTNVLLETYLGAVGVKTGFTSDAGNVLVAAAVHDGRRLISVALGSQDHFADSTALLDYGFARLARTVLVPRGTPVGSLIVTAGGGTGIVSSTPVRGLSRTEDVTVTLELDELPDLPLTPGQTVGQVVVRDHDKLIARIDAVVEGGIEAPREETSWAARALAGILKAFDPFVPGEA